MIKDTVLVTNPTGLHTRPAKRVVTEAKKFESSITISADGKEANLKSLIKLMKLGISQNASIEIQCDGPDEELALKTIKDFIANLKD